jgi:spoIIIJ-associated protein
MSQKNVIESAGKDVDAAIAAGLARLDLSRDDVEVEVLDEGRQGMFGLGARAARVRLKVKSGVEPKAVPQPQAPSPQPSARAEAPQEKVPQAKPRQERPPEAKTEEREPKQEPKQEPKEEPASEEEKAQVVKDAVKGLLSAMHFSDAQVEVRRAKPGPNKDEVPPYVVDVSGPGTDDLIGPDGEVLDAFQYIARLLVGRRMKGWVHVVVDVQGYKARRANKLRDLAHRMADQAADTDRAVILQPMPPHERRVVHVALYDDPRVTTESIYEGERRRVTILPKE